MSNQPLFFIQTIGCQMNSYDAEVYRNFLLASGWLETDQINDALLVMVNTCAVRQKSVDKAKNFILRLQHLKKERSFYVGLTGCASSLDDFEKLIKKGSVDFYHGPLNAMEVPESFKEFTGNLYSCSNKITATYQKKSSISAYLPIIHGCNSFCSYCIVPLVRGREISIPFDILHKTIRQGVSEGIKEWLLLGQNVNHYGMDFKQKITFSSLMNKIASIDGVLRLDFITSHPKEFEEDLLKVMQDHPTIYRHFHLPLQSGDDEILLRMKRGYTVARYESVIEKIRHYFPNASLTTDIIVGFPGETAKSFDNTMQFIEKIKFDTVYAAVYSHRPGTLSSTFPDILNPEYSKKQLQELLDMQKNIARIQLKRFLNSTNEVFILSSKGAHTYEGKTLEEKSIIVSSTHELKAGDLAKVSIESIKKGVLHGSVLV